MLLGVTVVSDAVVLISFAIFASLASAECLGQGIDTWALLMLVVSVFGSIIIGWIIGERASVQKVTMEIVMVMVRVDVMVQASFSCLSYGSLAFHRKFEAP